MMTIQVRRLAEHVTGLICNADPHRTAAVVAPAMELMIESVRGVAGRGVAGRGVTGDLGTGD